VGKYSLNKKITICLKYRYYRGFERFFWEFFT